MREPALCLIADDLTGALDAAAPFAARGAGVLVALTPDALGREAPKAMAEGIGVFAVSTDSREIAPELAAQRVAQVLAQLPPQMRLFKKIDSRMKGNIAAEISAIAPASLLVAPAIPDFDRRVEGGRICGFGVDQPIEIAAALGGFADRAMIPDCRSLADLDRALAACGGDSLLVGAKGLAEALAIRLTGQVKAVAARPRAERPLFAIGSRDPITLAQVDRLLAARAIDYRPAPSGHCADLGPINGLTLVQAREGPAPASGPEVAKALAQSLAPLFAQGADLLFVTGGATAQSVLANLGITHMRLLGECFPGLPLARAGDLAIMTKSGGFGGADTLVNLAKVLQGDYDG